MNGTQEFIDSLNKRRDALKEQIKSIGDMRPGSLVPRYRKCGKANCQCAKPGHPGHGPSYSLTRRVKGKTVTKIVAPDSADKAKGQIAEHQRFRRLCDKLVETSVQLCDAKFDRQKAEAKATAKKGASKKPSKPKFSRRSKR